MTDAASKSVAVLVLDLETSLRGEIRRIAGVLGNEALDLTVDGALPPEIPELDGWARRAGCVVGHNILQHDLPILAKAAPGLRILSLPVIDTLRLSPICFPQNPYHRLVKEYKLVRSSESDPVSDAQLAAILLRDEQSALRDLAEQAPVLHAALKHLLGDARNGHSLHAAGMRLLFSPFGPDGYDDAQTLDLVRQAIAPHACHTAAAALGPDDLVTEERRWSLAYTIAWLRVAGSDSVLPPWVRTNFPPVAGLLQILRDVPCGDPACAYCRETHDPVRQLRRYFNFGSFRETPADRDGQPLQQAIVTAGLRGEPLLAILPTGGGKSLCFQLPALVRNFRRGVLTVVVSPLQALMKDQVDNLRSRHGLTNVAALNGLLTPPERARVLRDVATGGTAVLYISPEQLRTRSLWNALVTREIGGWVLDEAHCLSKWGHDFRPDYLYVGRFIRRLAEKHGSPVPPVSCFTATAKSDVVAEICAYFREMGVDLKRFEGGVDRDNLRFEVQLVKAPTKLPRIHEVLEERLGRAGPGAGVVFRATRQDAEETARFLREHGWAAEHFHAGMTPPEKRRAQEAFLRGDIRIVCATNAFGMGIDKEDVRVVVHGDIPGSLENYLQEAGRAGRDREKAECVLLYDESDCNRQFSLGALSQLSDKDIASLLRVLVGKSRRLKTDALVVTSGELLRDEACDASFDAEDRQADTKVRTAVAWLERGGFVERNENATAVFQATPLVRTVEEARARIAGMEPPPVEAELWIEILRSLLLAKPNEVLTADRIMALPAFTGPAMVREARPGPSDGSRVFRTLNDMARAGLLKKDTRLTAYVRYKVADHSGLRLARVMEADEALIGLMREQEPAPEGWVALDLRLLNSELEARGVMASTEMIGRLLTSLAEDGRGAGGQAGSIEIRTHGHQTLRARLLRDWERLAELADRRRRIARVLLDAILGCVKADAAPQADLLVDFTYEQLDEALHRDPVLHAEVRDFHAAIERGLNFLHEQQILVLQQGLAIFRSAMTIQLLPEARGRRYLREDFQPLEHHYGERRFQVHVMGEYARLGLEKFQAAWELVLAYFTMDRTTFVARFFPGRAEDLERATTVESYREIVDALGNPAQMRIVRAPLRRNRLIMAGPGSGKTRTVVHRCAYLLRVERVKPSAILICCFNRRAAVELRRRLAALVGRDATGVTIQTYHGLALRILGRSLAGGARRVASDPDFDGLIAEARRMLTAEVVPAGMEPDEVRDRLLAGFEHILVDEYQDIDEPQYELISAIAGRTLQDDERKLTILAVGDDDQSIYRFRGANVSFIRRFREDYAADLEFLVENYRSTNYIIAASNAVIARNRDRMKTEHPIRIDRARTLDPAGGAFGTRDAETRGRVSVIHVADVRAQAAAMVAELQRLKRLGAPDWAGMAVLSRSRADLGYVRALAEAAGIPVRWSIARDLLPPLSRVREMRTAFEVLAPLRNQHVRADELGRLLLPGDESGRNLWHRLLAEELAAWREETADEPASVAAFIDFLHEALVGRRRDESVGEGVTLSTIHAAKGTEYDHVLLGGDWTKFCHDDAEEERRVLYVGMTRARQTLAVFHRSDAPNPFLGELRDPACIRRAAVSPGLESAIDAVDYAVLAMADLFLDYAGQKPMSHPVHAALAGLKAGDLLTLAEDGERLVLLDAGGCPVAVLSTRAAEVWRPRLSAVLAVRVLALVERRRDDGEDKTFQARRRVDRWEVPVCEVRWRPESSRRAHGSLAGVPPVQ